MRHQRRRTVVVACAHPLRAKHQRQLGPTPISRRRDERHNAFHFFNFVRFLVFIYSKVDFTIKQNNDRNLFLNDVINRPCSCVCSVRSEDDNFCLQLAKDEKEKGETNDEYMKSCALCEFRLMAECRVRTYHHRRRWHRKDEKKGRVATNKKQNFK